MQQPNQDPWPASSFFIRLWQEGTGAGGQWRGEVRHVQTGETAYFVRPRDLLAFLHAHGGLPPVHSRKKREPRVSTAKGG
jgi:hypothetical protein